MSKITNDRLNPVWHCRMHYSCTHMTTVGVKGLSGCLLRLSFPSIDGYSC